MPSILCPGSSPPKSDDVADVAEVGLPSTPTFDGYGSVPRKVGKVDVALDGRVAVPVPVAITVLLLAPLFGVAIVICRGPTASKAWEWEWCCVCVRSA